MFIDVLEERAASIFTVEYIERRQFCPERVRSALNTINLKMAAVNYIRFCT
jgi:hypothetical protein